jgi:hemolysin III
MTSLLGRVKQMKKRGANPLLDRIDLDYSISQSENLASSVVHMVGFGLNMTTAALLIVFSALKGSAIQIVSFSLFAAFMNIYLIFSVLFHILVHVEAKKVFKILEKCSGYLILTGVFIPLTLIGLGGTIGWIYLAVFLFLNLIAIINTAVHSKSNEMITTILNILIFIYIVLFFALNFPLISDAFMVWMGSAFLLFILGLILEGLKGVKFHHAIGHFYFLMANICLFFGFFFYLI